MNFETVNVAESEQSLDSGMTVGNALLASVRTKWIEDAELHVHAARLWGLGKESFDAKKISKVGAPLQFAIYGLEKPR